MRSNCEHLLRPTRLSARTRRRPRSKDLLCLKAFHEKCFDSAPLDSPLAPSSSPCCGRRRVAFLATDDTRWSTALSAHTDAAAASSAPPDRATPCAHSTRARIASSPSVPLATDAEGRACEQARVFPSALIARALLPPDASIDLAQLSAMAPASKCRYRSLLHARHMKRAVELSLASLEPMSSATNVVNCDRDPAPWLSRTLSWAPSSALSLARDM